MHANFSTCGAGGWLAPTGACAAPLWARWPYLEPWVATIAFFVWIALYKTLECGGDVRAAIKAQVDGDEKHVRIAGVGYFIGIYLFKQVAPPAEIDWSCPSPGFLVVETAVGVLAYDAIFYCLNLCGKPRVDGVSSTRHRAGRRVDGLISTQASTASCTPSPTGCTRGTTRRARASTRRRCSTRMSLMLHCKS